MIKCFKGWIWHGHEVVGLENIPDEGPALIIYYHGTLPIDVSFLTFVLRIYANITSLYKGVLFTGQMHSSQKTNIAVRW